jgi:hypothetical protein
VYALHELPTERQGASVSSPGGTGGARDMAQGRSVDDAENEAVATVWPPISSVADNRNAGGQHPVTRNRPGHPHVLDHTNGHAVLRRQRPLSAESRMFDDTRRNVPSRP